MVRIFKPLVRPNDEVVLDENHLGSGSYGKAYPARVMRNGKLIRKIVVKLMHETPLDSRVVPTHPKYPTILKGYQLWFEQIPEFQKKFPRLIFNNQQLVPLHQIKIVKNNQSQAVESIHKFAIASELYRKRNKHKQPMATRLEYYDDPDLKLEDLNQLENFIHECTSQQIPMHLDMFEVITSGYQKRIVVRDPDYPAFRLLNVESHAQNVLKLISEYKLTNHSNARSLTVAQRILGLMGINKYEIERRR